MGKEIFYSALFFLTYTFKLFVICFLINELSGISIPFNPLICFRVIGQQMLWILWKELWLRVVGCQRENAKSV